MEKKLPVIDIEDNGGRRRLRERRFLISAPFANERRTNRERRNGYDRRLRRISISPETLRAADNGR